MTVRAGELENFGARSETVRAGEHSDAHRRQPIVDHAREEEVADSDWQSHCLRDIENPRMDGSTVRLGKVVELNPLI
jgi:hypothetical protein